MVCHRAFRYRPTVLGKLLGSEHCILLQLADCWCSWCCLSSSCNQMLFLRSVVLPEKVCHLFFSCILLHSLKNVCQIYVPLFSCKFFFLFFSLFSYTGSKKVCQIYVPLFSCTAWKGLSFFFFLSSVTQPESDFCSLFSCTAWKSLSVICSCVQFNSLKKYIKYIYVLCSVIHSQNVYHICTCVQL